MEKLISYIFSVWTKKVIKIYDSSQELCWHVSTSSEFFWHYTFKNYTVWLKSAYYNTFTNTTTYLPESVRHAEIKGNAFSIRLLFACQQKRIAKASSGNTRLF